MKKYFTLTPAWRTRITHYCVILFHHAHNVVFFLGIKEKDKFWLITSTLVESMRGNVWYGWRNGAKFTKFIFIHIQCSYWYSRIYLFTFNNRIYIQEIYLFTFTCVFLIHDYICSHLRDVFIHIQRVISIHIHDRNIHSTFSAHHLCASVSVK